ncbi:MAG: hypothetical protein M3Z16_04155, partial [Pseudomonadota bacterium]|nr:hypothetical protein [Pseudomonadota bacterium]
SLLAEHGIALTLIAPPPTATLFRGDRGFVAVSDDGATIEAANFDFAIVDSDSRKALALKRRHAAALPWVSIRAAYLGYDFQRGLLAARRFAAWLGLALTPAEEARHATQKLLVEAAPSASAGGSASLERGTTVAAADVRSGADDTSEQSRRRRVAEKPSDRALAGVARHPSPLRQIAIALGGVRAERSYRRWGEVARLVAESLPCCFILLGSGNASADRDAFVAMATDAARPLQLEDRVATTSLHEAAQAMAECDLILCADGGLMHLALTTSAPIVALFDASVDPAWRLPAARQGSALRAAVRDVNAIAPERVAAAALRALAAEG